MNKSKKEVLDQIIEIVRDWKEYASPEFSEDSHWWDYLYKKLDKSISEVVLDLNYMKELELATEAAIKEAEKVKHLFEEEDINWDDLSCIDVTYVQSIYGEKYYSILIMYAPPLAVEFQNFIYNELQGDRFLNFLIETDY